MSNSKKLARKWIYGSSTLISTILFLGSLVIIALLANSHPWRIDLTKTKRYTLSDQTKKILRSLTEPITVKAFFATASRERENAKDLLEAYNYINSRIKYTFIDPDRHPEVARRYGIREYGTLVLEGYGKKQMVQNIGEENLTNAILKLMQKKRKKICFLKGHGEHSIKDFTKEGYSTLSSALEKENYEVSELNLMTRSDVPKDAAVVVIAGPKKPLFKEEKKALNRYLKRGGKIVLLLDPGSDGGMEDFVSAYGIKIENDMVIDKLSRVFGGSYLMPVVMQYGIHKITEGFNIATFYPGARSVRRSKKPTKGVDLITLASTSRNAWAETDLKRLEQGEASFDEKNDLPGPVPLIILAKVDLARYSKEDHHTEVNGKENNNKEAYLLVAGDSDFIDNTHFGLSGNGDFALNIINFLAQEENLITVKRSKPNSKPLILTQSQARIIFWIPVVMVPLTVGLIGVIVYRIRRLQK